MNQLKEKLLFVTCPCAKPDKLNDAIVVIDVDEQSHNYSKILKRLLLPHKSEEIRHFGWNSSSLNENDRTHLICPSLNSSRIYIINVIDQTYPKIEKIIEKESLEKWNVTHPHTVHCPPDGNILISTLGDKGGNEKSNYLILDNKTFEIKGTWFNGDKNDDTILKINNDFWYQSNKDLMVNTKGGSPNIFIKGFDPNKIKQGNKNNNIYVYNWKTREELQSIKLDNEDSWLPSGLRFKHNSDEPHAFFANVFGTSIYHLYQDLENIQGMKHRVAITIPKKKVENWVLTEMPPLITDLAMSIDDKYLFVSCWFHGDVRMYDISDPFNIRLVGQCFIGGLITKKSKIKIIEDKELNHKPDPVYIHGKKIEGGPQMLKLSLDGKRLYVTTSFYQKWDEEFYPSMILNGSTLLQLNIDNDPESMNPNRLSLNKSFGINFGNLFENNIPYLAQACRFPNDDCFSDVWY